MFTEEKSSGGGGSLISVMYTKDGRFIKSAFDRKVLENFKNNEWNKVTVTGKIDKKTDLLYVGPFFSGKIKLLYDDIRLFVKKGGIETEIQIPNGGFENDSLSPWKVSNSSTGLILKTTSDRFVSGNKSLLIDNTTIKSNAFGSNDAAGNFVSVNGIKLYYETYGSGEPLILLHGNSESIASFEKQIPDLSKVYKVIAIDTRGQGNSSSDSTKFTYELFAEDVNALMEQLNVKNANILGWSDGGNIGLLLAMKHPDKVIKLATMGANLYNSKESVPEEINIILKKQIAELKKSGTPETDNQIRLKTLLLTEPNIDSRNLASITCPVLIMAGEKDIIKEAHTKLIAAAIQKSQLKIFEKADHDAPKTIPEEFNSAVLRFFERN